MDAISADDLNFPADDTATTPSVTETVVSKTSDKPAPAKQPSNKRRNTALIATAAVAGVALTGGLIGGLVGGGKKSDKDTASSSNTETVPPELEQIMQKTGGILGYVDKHSVTLVPLPTVYDSDAPIVNISNRAVVVVKYNKYNLPFYLDAKTMSWMPLLGIGEQGGWFNVYPDGKNTGISAIDSIRGILNKDLIPSVVQRYVAPQNNGIQFPAAAAAAYPIINFLFVNGVVQSYDGHALSAPDQQLYNSNYQLIKNLLN